MGWILTGGRQTSVLMDVGFFLVAPWHLLLLRTLEIKHCFDILRLWNLPHEAALYARSSSLSSGKVLPGLNVRAKYNCIIIIYLAAYITSIARIYFT